MRKGWVMCTTLVYRENRVLVGMNFDNNGARYRIDTSSGGFIVQVDGGNGLWPSFGVTAQGVFFNSQEVDSNGKGLYKRAGKKVTHMSKLVQDIISGALHPHELNDYLKQVEVVNTPNRSVHNLICDPEGNVWVIEPGRGNIYTPAGESPSVVLSNCSLHDYRSSEVLAGSGADRYQLMESSVLTMPPLDVEDVFALLNPVRQAGVWTTDLSLVYDAAARTVTYRENGEAQRFNPGLYHNITL